MKKSKLILMIIMIVLVLGIGVLGFGYIKSLTQNKQNPIVTMDVEGYGTLKIELYPEYAPQTVANFIKLIENGYFDGLTFHRVVANSLIQGGDKEGTGSGGVSISDLYKDSDDESGYTIKGEFIANGFNKNTLRFERGTIGMGRANYTSISPTLKEESYNSAGSQFFIMCENKPMFNGIYCPFGKVIEGMEIVDQISALETKVEVNEETGEETKTEEPLEKPIISKMTVDTFGKDYGYPETLTPFDYMSYLMSMYNLQY